MAYVTTGGAGTESGGPLDEADLAPLWTTQLERWMEAAGEAGVVHPNAMSLATVDADGRPSVRTVLLRAIEPTGLVFYTNRLSRKGKALQADPRAAVVIPWVSMMRQVCVTGDVEEVSREQTESYFHLRPVGSQLAAWVSRQSEVIAGREVLDARQAMFEQRFGDTVPVPGFWGGFRLLPLTVEFWSGREKRLHDRLRLRRTDGRPGRADDGGWTLERLAP